MEKVIIYHNNRCTKSRQALEVIKKKSKTTEVIEYLKTPLTEKEIKDILKKLGMKAEEIIRKKEPLFQSEYKNKKNTESEWIKVLAKNPLLIERPIIVKGSKAVIGRPTENINKLF